MPRGVNTQDEGRIQGRNVVNANSSNIVAPGIVTDGLVLNLDAGNYQSYPIAGSTLYDLMDGKTNASLVGGAVYDRAGGGSISLDGTGDYITLPDTSGITDFSVSENYTIDFWVYINSTQNPAGFTAKFIVEKWSVSGGYPYVFRYLGSSPDIEVAVYNGTSVNGLTIGVSTNSWTNVCGVFNWSRGLLSVYVDGGKTTATATLNLTGTITNSSLLYLGSRGSENRGDLTGKFSSYRSYNRALTPTEVAQNFNATRARFNV